MENSCVMSCVNGGISCNDLPQNIFTVSWSQKLKGFLGGLTPLFSVRLPHPPLLKAQDHKEAFSPTLRKGHPPWFHIKGEGAINIHIQPNQEREPWKQKVKQIWPYKESKCINHIHLVSVHFIQYTFWPSCGFKTKEKLEMTWLWHDKQIMCTFVLECWCVWNGPCKKDSVMVMCKERRLVRD